jgi:hypothetical protein
MKPPSHRANHPQMPHFVCRVDRRRVRGDDLRELRLDQKHQSLGQYAVILHRVGHRLVRHRGHNDVQVSNIHQHRDNSLGWAPRS